jgi:hypothetical protein
MNNNTQQQQQQQENPTDPKPKILQSKVLKKVLTQGKPNKKHTLNLHQKHTKIIRSAHNPSPPGGGETKNKTHQHKPPAQWNNTYNIHTYMDSNAMESSYPKNSSKQKEKRKKEKHSSKSN